MKSILLLSLFVVCMTYAAKPQEGKHHEVPHLKQSSTTEPPEPCRHDIPVDAPTTCMRDGCAYIGVALSRASPYGNPLTVTRQEQFDLCSIIDREYEHVGVTDDSGWLVCGGISSQDPTAKLVAPDSGHAEILHTGVLSDEYGGSSLKTIVKVMNQTPFAPLRLKPAYVRLNPDNELELRYEVDTTSAIYKLEMELNYKLGGRPCSRAEKHFHTTLARKVGFRSTEHKIKYFERVQAIIQNWRTQYPYGALLGTDEIGYGNVYLYRNRETIIYTFKPTLPDPYADYK